jgi:hypothetical protein
MNEEFRKVYLTNSIVNYMVKSGARDVEIIIALDKQIKRMEKRMAEMIPFYHPPVESKREYLTVYHG